MSYEQRRVNGAKATVATPPRLNRSESLRRRLGASQRLGMAGDKNLSTGVYWHLPRYFLSLAGLSGTDWSLGACL